MARSTRRLVAALGLSAATMLAAGACAEITTLEPYAPSDGVRVEVGSQLRAENLLVLTPAEGAEGVLLGAIANEWDSDTTVDLQFEGVSDPISVDVAGGSSTLLDPEHEHVTIPSVPARPGALLPLTISSPEAGSVTVDVPVLDGTIPPYDEIVPAAPEE